jgi:hypothetical protein
MKGKHRSGPCADDKDNGARLPEIICDTATNSFLQEERSGPEIAHVTAKDLAAIFDRRVFLMAMAAAPLGFVCPGRKPPQAHGASKVAMFVRRI